MGATISRPIAASYRADSCCALSRAACQIHMVIRMAEEVRIAGAEACSFYRGVRELSGVGRVGRRRSNYCWFCVPRRGWALRGLRQWILAAWPKQSARSSIYALRQGARSFDPPWTAVVRVG